MENHPTYKVLIDETTRDFLDGLSPKEGAVAARKIQLLQQLGPRLTRPHTRQIDGKLWELRFRCDKKNFRLFYTIDANRQIYISYGIHKTSKRTPKKDKKLATKRAKKQR